MKTLLLALIALGASAQDLPQQVAAHSIHDRYGRDSATQLACENFARGAAEAELRAAQEYLGSRSYARAVRAQRRLFDRWLPRLQRLASVPQPADDSTLAPLYQRMDSLNRRYRRARHAFSLTMGGALQICSAVDVLMDCGRPNHHGVAKCASMDFRDGNSALMTTPEISADIRAYNLRGVDPSDAEAVAAVEGAPATLASLMPPDTSLSLCLSYNPAQAEPYRLRALFGVTDVLAPQADYVSDIVSFACGPIPGAEATP